MKVQPYLFFDGRTEEALKFYQKVLGAEVVMLMRFDESPEPPPPGTLAPGSEKKVMHCAFTIDGQLLMASDGCNNGNQPDFRGISLSLTVATETDAQRIFGALAEGGAIQMPLTKTFFSPQFGMVADQFGVSWMLVVEAPTT